jgi:phosphatidylglycerophosphate synthase
MSALIKPSTGYLDVAYDRTFVLPTVDAWHGLGFTPNMLTTLGLLSSTGAIKGFWSNDTGYAMLFTALRMYFDSADGIMARKYKMTSDIGDYYDHGVDLFFSIGMFYVTVKKFPVLHRRKAIGALILTYVLFALYMACIKKECGTKCNNDESLSLLVPLGNLCDNGWDKVWRIFDTSFAYLVLFGIIYARHRLTKGSSVARK